MVKFPQPGRSSRQIHALALGLALVAAAAAAGPHPSLVDPAATRCTTCHDDLLGGTVVHAAAEDCLSCHEFSKQESRTVVALAAAEPDLCLSCHDAQQEAAEGALAAPHAPVLDGCTTCHSPHSSDVGGLLSAARGDLCLSCHSADDVNGAHQVPVSRTDCTSCHAAHGSATAHMLTGSVLHVPFAEGTCDACHKRSRGTRVRLGAEGAEICYACHADKEEEFATGSVHTAVREGRCTGCHDPHMSDQPDMLEASGAELCLPCHAEIGAKLDETSVHPPVEDGCDTCHDPHRSDHRAQLVAATDELCGTCHDVTDDDLVATHLGADMSAIDCTSCHDPHGSSNPGLVVTGSMHPPFAEGACDSCHEGSADALVEGGSRDLCYACHADKEDEFASYAVPHAALEADECTACHSPHAAARPGLIRAGGGAVCTACHADQAAGEGQVTHGVIDWIGCQACHSPHGGDNPNLLVATGNALCNGCHLAGAVRPRPDGSLDLGGHVVRPDVAAGLTLIDLDSSRTVGHPLPNHPVAGTVEAPSGRSQLVASLVGTELTCLSCHVPHAGATPQLFAYGATTSAALCTSCHPN